MEMMYRQEEELQIKRSDRFEKRSYEINKQKTDYYEIELSKAKGKVDRFI